jgi:hypothetical protein
MMDILPGTSVPGGSTTAKRPTCTARSVPSGNRSASLIAGAVGQVTPVEIIPEGCRGMLRRDIALPAGYS